MEFIKKDISDGIEVVGVPVNRFKTNLITVSIALKLEKDKVSANSVMLGLLALFKQKTCFPLRRNA